MANLVFCCPFDDLACDLFVDDLNFGLCRCCSRFVSRKRS